MPSTKLHQHFFLSLWLWINLICGGGGRKRVSSDQLAEKEKVRLAHGGDIAICVYKLKRDCCSITVSFGAEVKFSQWAEIWVVHLIIRFCFCFCKIYLSWDENILEYKGTSECLSWLPKHPQGKWMKTVLKGIWKKSLRMGFWKFTKCKSFESHINTYWRAITKEEALIKSNREIEPTIWHLPSSVIITMHTWMELPWWQEGRLVYKPKHHWLPLIKLDPDIATTKCPNYQPQRPTLSWWYGTMPQRQQQVTW